MCLRCVVLALIKSETMPAWMVLIFLGIGSLVNLNLMVWPKGRVVIYMYICIYIYIYIEEDKSRRQGLTGLDEWA